MCCGSRAWGKTTFHRERRFDTHVRMSLGLPRTRRRERLLLAACREGGQPFVVDDTNPTVTERARSVAFVVTARLPGGPGGGAR